MVETAYSLIPPIVVIILLLTTKRLVPSLIIGIILGSHLYADWNPLNAAEAAGGWMWDVLTGAWKILTFTLLVGALSSMLRVSGGVSAFADWAYVHANTPRKAQLAVLLVGFLTFFSDGFSCLLRANVLRSLTDKHRVSHSKLAYLVHSSSAPYALMVPISAIAGMTIAIISRTYDSIGMNTNQAFSAFIQAIPMNYYNILTIILVFIVGAYLAGVIETNNFPVALLPLVLFVFSAFMSYAMGSTLGTAGLMIPIGAEIVVNIDPWFLIPVVGAVLPGCVFGEHTSPLSDTTIMSSIGSQVDAFDHIITQMPYAIITSIASIIGYLVLGYSQNVAIGLITALGTLILLVFAAKFYYQRRPDDGSDYEVLETTSPEAATR